MSHTAARLLLPRSLSALAILLLSSLICLAGKHFVMPTAQPAKTYPAHDEHPNEGVTVGLDPYDAADKASIFSVHYNDAGLIPIFVVITNDGDQPVALSGMKAELVTLNPGKISQSPLPFPKKASGSMSKDAMEEVPNAQFAAKAVEPHGTQSGFMFFDVSGISTPLAGAHFYLTGVKDAKGNELMYFDVSLEKYLSAPSKPN